MENLEIRKLSENDIENVFEIEKTFFDVNNSDSILSSLKSETLDYFLLFKDEILIGFFECSIVLDEAELYEIAIVDGEQGKCYSNLLMKYFFDYCDKKKVSTIFLEVNKINNKAISLYKKFGFSEYSIRKNYYGENDAVLMKVKR